ncbi:hypothetical protein CC80DRAFT_232468 [Byssothecium circinans]|uniref:DUF7580 domain-containing protein n=1 Tax=Byssothecium circinans TaxID=147558 RepID=A0A6A5U7R3_9PLEO|nr:hypothetical protein CC80DRAFT_232468 [Byssothecium circinans]
MATGVETAGLVLATIPLILECLKFYMKGIETTKRCFKYREQFHSLVRELSTENAVYINTLNLLLDGTVKPKDMAEFLSDPRGSRWKDEKFDRKLKQRLGASYEPYMETMDDLKQTVEKFKQRLKLDPTGKPCFTDEYAFKKYYKGLALSLRKADYDDLLGTIRRSNESLHRITKQTMTLESLQVSRKSDERPVPNYSTINNRAQGFHSALRAGWQCPCHDNHSVNLRLEPRIDCDGSDESDDEEIMRDPFHVLFRNSHHEPTSPAGPVSSNKMWTWEEADVHITVEIQSTPKTTLVAGKGVRFADQAKNAVKAALSPDPDMQPIKNLCAAICTLQKPQRAACLSLLADEYEKQKYDILIYPAKDPPVDTEAWTTSTLRTVLQDPAFARRNRLQLAVTLASSVLQLHETPWLDDNWTKDDILFIKRSDKIVYNHPFVSQHFAAPKQSESINNVPALMRRIIRNQSLYGLGISLIELWHGKAISELKKTEDESETTFMTEFNTADRLVDELYSDAGGKYADAVRRCIRCDFDHRATSLENTAFQRAVYQGVVAQLKENFDFLHPQAQY